MNLDHSRVEKEVITEIEAGVDVHDDLQSFIQSTNAADFSPLLHLDHLLDRSDTLMFSNQYEVIEEGRLAPQSDQSLK